MTYNAPAKTSDTTATHQERLQLIEQTRIHAALQGNNKRWHGYSRGLPFQTGSTF